MIASLVKIGDGDYVNKAPLREGLGQPAARVPRRKFNAAPRRRETFLRQRAIEAVKVNQDLRLPGTPRGVRVQEVYAALIVR